MKKHSICLNSPVGINIRFADQLKIRVTFDKYKHSIVLYDPHRTTQFPDEYVVRFEIWKLPPCPPRVD